MYKLKDILKFASTDKNKRESIMGLCFKAIGDETVIMATDGYAAIAVQLGKKIKGLKDLEIFTGTRLRDLMYFTDTRFVGKTRQLMALGERLQTVIYNMAEITYPEIDDNFPDLEGLLEINKKKWPTGKLSGYINLNFIEKTKPFFEDKNYRGIRFLQDDKKPNSPVYIDGLVENVTVIIMPIKQPVEVNHD